MKNMLYLEGACGISGDMTVAALLDLGGNREKLDAVLKSLRLDGFSYAVSYQNSYGIAGCDFDVTLASETEEPGHPHAHEGEHHHHHHHHEHRNLADVEAVIDRGEMSDTARGLAKKIFCIVAQAEAKAHGCPVEEVHFHEVGAVDSIVDIVSAAVLADDLGVCECVVTGLTEGTGTVRCQHGDLPVPVPAVLNIAQAHAISLHTSASIGEMVTPTGIAIAAALRTRDSLPSRYRVERIGVGLGKRDFGRANILRAMLISEDEDPERISLVECNIDDATGEMLGLAMDALFKAGAKDVHFVPCFMKKNRPAYLLRIIAEERDLPEIEATLFRTTTTIGLRKYPVDRSCMSREWISVSLPCGTVKVKKCAWNGLVRFYPEYESVREVEESSGVDFRTVFADAVREAEEKNV